MTGVCAGTGTLPLTNTQADAFIDDFEEASGISPGWSSFNDVSPTINAFQIAQVAGGAVSTAHAGHYAGTGAKQPPTPGALRRRAPSTTLRSAANRASFASTFPSFTGVSFWAKAATGGSTIALNFVVPQANEPVLNDAGVQVGGGDCEASCYNYPHVSFTLTTSWAQYTAEFSAATGGTAKVSSVIQEVEWISPDTNWDFTLDEIAFYSGTPPTGAVGPNPVGAGGGEDAGPPISEAGSD